LSADVRILTLGGQRGVHRNRRWQINPLIAPPQLWV
jgi:hypothetical protein